MRPSNDKEAITLILEGMEKEGWKTTEVCDDSWNPDDLTKVSTVAEAVDLVTGVDEAIAYLSRDGVSGWIYFVLGNDPEEVASNYTVNLDPELSNITDPWSL